MEQPLLLINDSEVFMTRNRLKTWKVSRCLVVLTIFLSVAGSAQAGVWLTNSPTLTVQLQATATLLQNGKVLVAGGVGADQNETNSAELFDPTTGSWKYVGSLHVPRSGHAAALLPNGKVLVVGGFNDLGSPAYLKSAELYDPVSETWADTGPLQTARDFPTLTLLPNGKVLVAGGADTSTNTPSAELYDPATGTWTSTGNMNEARAFHTATLLPNGQVMVAGGNSDSSAFFNARSTIEVYDPAQGNWTLAGTMEQPRIEHTATLLPDGRVLLAGGISNSFIAGSAAFSSAEVFDPVHGTNGFAASMHSPHAFHSATLLPNGTVLVSGGFIGSATSSASTNATEIYDPATDTWTVASNLNTARWGQRTVLLPGGEILAVGGATNLNDYSFKGTEIYDPTINPATGAWAFTGSMQNARRSLTATLLPNGKVLVAGGENGSGSAYTSCELYDPLTGLWSNTGSLNFSRFHHAATLLANGKVLVTGGGNSFFNTTPELYDPATGLWTTNGTIPGFLSANTATLLRNGQVLVVGFLSSTNPAQIYNAISDTWSPTGPMITPRNWHKAVSLADGRVLIVGGQAGSTNVLHAEIYDPILNQWKAAGTTREYSYSYTAAALLPSGKVLVAGTDSNSLPVAEIFDPATGLWNLTGAPFTNHFFASLTTLPGGKALLAAGTATPELYDPATGNWTTTPPLNENRYDDRVVVLPNGEILEVGGTYNSGIASAEIFDTGLFATNSLRPQITSATPVLNLGAPLAINGTGFRGISGASGSCWDSATDYPLVQLRSMESGQTTYLLTTNWSTNSFSSLPVWNFPPGQALATVFVNGIQSTSALVNISVPLPSMTTLMNPQVSANKAFQFAFTNAPGAMFGVLASTNLALPSASWTRLNGVTEISPGNFVFTDSQATNSLQNFYRLFAP